MIRIGILAAATSVVVVTGCSGPVLDPLPRREVAAPTAADPARPCVRETPAAPAPGGLDVWFDPAANTIVLAAGTGNETFANTAQGININESSGDTVRDNLVYDNGESGIGVTQTSDGTVVQGNQIRGNNQDGVRAVSEATDTIVRDNVIAENVRHGVYVDTTGTIDITGNTITANRTGITSEAIPVGSEQENTLHSSEESDIVVR